MRDVFFFEAFREEEDEIKKSLSSSIQAEYFGGTIQEMDIAEKPPARIISIRTQSQIPKHWLPHLQAVLSRSTGCDHLQKIQASNPMIALGYLPDYCVRAVAEHAVMMLMVLFKKLKLQMQEMDRFNRDHLTGSECQSRKVLVVGVGRIGSEICRLAKSFGMDVHGMDLDKRHADIHYVDLEEGLLWAEAVCCALPLTPITNGLLNYEKLKVIKRGSYFLNISRGEISPAQDLRRLLDEEILAGCSLDVYEDEREYAVRLRTGCPQQGAGLIYEELRKHSQVVFTPHNAFNSKEAVLRKAQQSAEAIESFIEKKRFPHQAGAKSQRNLF